MCIFFFYGEASGAVLLHYTVASACGARVRLRVVTLASLYSYTRYA